MSIELARLLYQTGRAHAGAACLLYRAAVHHAAEEGIEDPVSHVFNGQNSLSIQVLLGLGLELMLKSAIAALDESADEAFLRKEIGHDLVKALDEAEKRGFASQAPHLGDILNVMQAPYGKHWFRYGRPDQFALPDDFDQVVSTLDVFDQELIALLEDDA